MFCSYSVSWKTQALLQQRKRRSLLSQLLISLRNKQVSLRLLSHVSPVSLVVLEVSKTFLAVIIKAFASKNRWGTTFFTISCGIAALHRPLTCNPLSNLVSQQSHMSQGLSHLQTLSKTTPLDVLWLGLKKPRSTHLGLGKCGR